MKTGIILASGPSLTQAQIDYALATGHHVMAINATYQKALTATTVYCGDFLTWKEYIADIRKRFKGEMWSQDSTSCARWPDIHRVRAANRDGLGKDGLIHLGGNSGTQAVNLLYTWGFKKIVLVGFDMCLGPNGEKHHHDDHPKPLVQALVFSEWKHKLEWVARDLKKEGIDVVNCSLRTELSCFRLGRLEEEC
jgi:hypothetical protein